MAHTLSRSLRRRTEGGTPLRTVFHKWDQAEIRLRRGQVTMIAGMPNAGKTMLANHIAINVGEPTLYVSADSDEPTQVIRTAASVSGVTVKEVEETFNLGAGRIFKPDLDRAAHVSFSFDPAPTLEDIALDVEAFIEMTGDAPHLLIVDNLMNIETDGEDWGGTRQIPKAMHHFARHYESAVLLLHHCSEWGRSDQCPSRAAIQGKISQLPELIVTIALTPDGHMLTCAVKNRCGPSWPRGDHPVSLYARPERMGLYEDSMSYLAAGRSW